MALSYLLTALALNTAAGQIVPLHVVLQNDRIEATIQSGTLMRLRDRVTGQVLLSMDPADAGELQISTSEVLDLPRCKISGQQTNGSVAVQIESPDGTQLDLNWEIQPGQGDLILHASVRSQKELDELRMLFLGCDIGAHKIVGVTNVGVGQEATAPWIGIFSGDPKKDAPNIRYVQPLIFLFQGQNSGWVVEGRDLQVGPACVMAKGLGDTANIGFVRSLPVPSRTMEMYEIRFRTYRGQWEDAVDPYVDWMQHDLGFVPLDQQSPSWISNIQVQANVLCGDYASLDKLAKVLDPSKTALFRNNGYRNFPVDMDYPDYRLSDAAKKWVKYAKNLGFHIGIWVNTTGIDSDAFPELAERFRPGFEVTGHDATGKEQYWNIPGRQIYCSAAYKPWRDYLVQQLKDAADSGVDCIHLDEADTPTGKFLIDGTTAIQGVMLLVKQIRDTYPQMAVQTEEFNPMCSRYASFCFSEFDDGHRLGGYIFHKFIKFYPEGYMAAPMMPSYMDANEKWGFFMPVADVKWSQSWLPIARAFEYNNLSAAPRFPLRTGRLSAYTGKNGVTAFFETEPHRRGLVVYQSGKQPAWYGTRYFGITKWGGPGALRSWPAYDGQTLIGLDPTKSYYFDRSIRLPQDWFHITDVPADFAMYTDPYLDIRPGEDSGHDVGSDGSFFRIKMTGHGEVAMHVPDDFSVFQDGEEVQVDRSAQTARIDLNASGDKFSLLWAYRKLDVPLVGKCVNLHWQVSPRQRDGHFVPKDDSFITAVTATGLFIGRLPDSNSIHLTGSYGLLPGSVIDVGDNRGVIRINGKEVSSTLIVGANRPYPIQNFDVDLSAYAGQHVVLEFLCDGFPHLWAAGEWYSPTITAK